MSSVVVSHGQRSTTIKVSPTLTLSAVRAQACQKFNLTPSSWSLKRNNKLLDLSLPIRFANLPPGAKLELVRPQSGASTAPVSVVLRIVDTTAELTGSFAPSDTVWAVLRKLEKEARAAGREKVNITERGEPNATAGAGRLMYQMPAVRVLNRELAGFEELAQSLESLGCGRGRVLLVLRFRPTETPYEEALQRIDALLEEKEGKEGKGEEAGGSGGTTGVSTPDAPMQELRKDEPGDVEMADPEQQPPETTPNPPPVDAAEERNKATTTTTTEEETSNADPGSEPASSVVEESSSKIIVFAPSEGPIPAAATLENADSDYDISISELKKIRQNYHQASLPQRLLSDKEREEKEASERDAINRIETLTVKVRLPDGYHIMQRFAGKSTAADLYATVRSTLTHPTAPFTLLIPPVTTLPESSKRLTIDLKLRSNTTLHLKWADTVGDTVRKQPALNEEYRATARELPKPVVPDLADEDNRDGGEPGGDAKEKEKEKRKGAEGASKELKEKKLKNFLRLGRK